MAIKPIKPSLKAKKRYLAFEIISEDKIQDISSISNTINQKTSSLIGEKAFGEAHIVVIKDLWNQNSQKGIIKVSNKHIDNLKAGMCLVQEIEGHPAIIKSRGVSGILKKAKAKYLA